MRRATGIAAAAFAAVALVLACGDVPTLPGGVAYITPILLPSPTVAWGDTLRDSLGRAAPLRVFAIGRDSTDTISDVSLRYILTSLGSGASIDERGYLVAPDSLKSLRVVAQVTGSDAGLRLQTPEVTIEVVPRADSIAKTSTAGDTALSLPVVRPLSVTVTGLGPTLARAAVNGIRVRYRIAQVYPASVPTAGRYYLTAEGSNGVLRPDSTIALDTTASGIAVRNFVGIRSLDGSPDADSVLVTATGLSQKGVPLNGSPVRFMLRFKP